MIEASAEDPRITRRAPSLVPRVSPSCGAGGSEEGRRDPLARLPAAQGRQQGPTVPNGPGPGRRLECALPKQTAACGNPPPFPPATETAPRRVPWRLSRYRFPSIPREGRARGSLTTGRLQLASLSICPAACRSSSTQEYSGPSLSATRLLPLDHLSLSKPTLCFQRGGKVLPCLSSPWCGERSRQNRAEETSGGAWLIARLPSQWSPGCGAALASHKSTNVVRTAIRGRGHSSPSHLGPASERRVLPEVQEVDASSVIGLEATARRL